MASAFRHNYGIFRKTRHSYLTKLRTCAIQQPNPSDDRDQDESNRVDDPPAGRRPFDTIGDQATRLVSFVDSTPRRTRRYFKSPWKRALWGAISLLSGFYIANVVSLSFGSISANDVLAAAVVLVMVELTTAYYYSQEKPTFALALANAFKIGFTYGLFVDAFKLGS
eukprot:jgi/Mesvir1/3580/Mv12043-RA.1